MAQRPSPLPQKDASRVTGGQGFSGNNPFMQNQFSPYGPFASGMKSGGNQGEVPGSLAANNTGGQMSYSLGDKVGAGLTGLGNFLTGMEGNRLTQNQQQLQGAGQLANAINGQSQIAQSGSQAALNASGPDKTVMPFAQMALARALAQGGPSQLSVPSHLQAYTPQISDGFNWKGLQDVSNQYFNDSAIQNAMSQFDKQRINVDPYAQPNNYTSFFGPESGGAAQNDMTAWQQQAQQRRADSNNTANLALQQALNNNKTPGWQKFLGGAASIAGSVLPFFL